MKAKKRLESNREIDANVWAGARLAIRARLAVKLFFYGFDGFADELAKIVNKMASNDHERWIGISTITYVFAAYLVSKVFKTDLETAVKLLNQGFVDVAPDNVSGYL